MGAMWDIGGTLPKVRVISGYPDIRAWALGLRVWVQGLAFRVEGLGFGFWV